MISSKLKRHFIQRKVKKLLNNKMTAELVASNKKIQTIGILTKEKYFQAYDLQTITTDQLEVHNPKVYSLRNFEKNQEISYKHFTENDFNWKGNILEPSFKSFVEEPLDLLICYYTKPHAILDYVTLLSKASFKIGFTGVNSQFYDLEIAVKSDEFDDFFYEAKKYLSILGKL